MLTTISLFTKTGGPLTKTIALDDGGRIVSDGRSCVMSAGTARRVQLADIGDLAAQISACQSCNAVSLGALRPPLPDEVRIVAKGRLKGDAGVVARTAENLV